MIKFMEKIFSIPVIIVLEVLLLAMRLAKMLVDILNDMTRSGVTSLEFHRDKMIKTAEEKNQKKSEDKNEEKNK